MGELGARLATATLVLAGVVLVLAALLWLGQRRLVYFPSQVVPDAPPPGVEAVTLSTHDGIALAAWFVPGAPTRATGTTVLVLPGNGGNRVGRLPLARALAARGHGVLLVDYRGYGANPGSPSTAGLALDARAARDWVRDRAADDPAVDDERVVYLGESLGAGVAIELALARPPAALVLRSPFTSLADVARVHYPVVPTLLLWDRWPNLARIPRVDAPILFVAGSADEIVPADQTRRLHDAAGDPKQLLVVDGARHNDRVLLGGEELVDAVDDFLAAHLPPRTSS